MSSPGIDYKPWRFFIASRILFPLMVVNVCVRENNVVHIGYTDVFVFGFRIARISRTKPWE